MQNTNPAPRQVVDPAIAFTETRFIPSGAGAFEQVEQAAYAAVGRARNAGRQPVLIEVTVRVAP